MSAVNLVLIDNSVLLLKVFPHIRRCIFHFIEILQIVRCNALQDFIISPELLPVNRRCSLFSPDLAHPVRIIQILFFKFSVIFTFNDFTCFIISAIPTTTFFNIPSRYIVKNTTTITPFSCGSTRLFRIHQTI